jgi:hypothetical protein
MSASVKYRARRGYTLFELLLSLGLAAALLVLISTAIGLFERFSSAGRARAEQSQIARALLDKMETDFRSIVYRERKVVPADISSLIIPIGALTAEQESVDSSAGADLWLGNMGIIGDQQHLLLQVDRASRAKLDINVANSVSVGMGYALWSVSTTSTVDDSGHKQTGLSRLDLDKLPQGFDQRQTFIPDSILAGKFEGHVLASEVIKIQFRYLDHDGWHNSWNSVVEQRLPRSIEVTFTFDTRREIPNAKHDIRAVIPILLSEPFVPQTDSRSTLRSP